MNKEKFEYRFSAPTEEERREIESIKREYGNNDGTVSALDEIRRYDARVKNPAKIWSLTLGVVGILVFGLGMSLVLEWFLYLAGVLTALAGIAVMGLAYPVYAYSVKCGKRKYGDKILRLLKEIDDSEKNGEGVI